MTGKKEMLAQFASHTGITRVLESLPGRGSLLILNYHRVGDPRQTPYDSGLYSCTGAEFDWQVDWLKRRYPILNLHQAVDIVHGRSKPTRTSILLTFDDGYLDNYKEAFPVLRKHNVSATFFLPTFFVGSHALPWWDEIAYMIKQTKLPRFAVSYPEAAEYDLTERDRLSTVVDVLDVFKRYPVIDTERFVRELSAATGVDQPGDHTERCFLNWDEAREMQAAGMCFGSHTHMHEILARLPYEQQVEELKTSRRILEAELGGKIDTLAYPRGKHGTFSELTFDALRAADYSTAFSFYSGVNKPGAINPLDVLREAVEMESRSIFRLRHSTCAAMGRSVV
jgi:peptidoglycan/xylan/chitin deacetylase (PgdA/CDA1 family)